MADHEYTEAELDRMTDADLLRAAIAEARGRPNSYEFELSQIWGGIARGNDELEAVFVSETAPPNVRAIFHLTGEGVTEHSTEASMLADLISGVAKSARAQSEHIAKQRRSSAGKSKALPAEYVARPLMATGLGAGSVVFALETTPDDRAPGKDGLALFPDSDTLDDQAFRAILDVVASDGDEIVLNQLGVAARRALLPAADALGQASVDIDITITQRRRPTQRREVRTSRVRMLTEVLKRPEVDTEPFRIIAEIDGYKASESRVYLRAEGESLSYSVDGQLLSRIRRLAEEESAIFDCSGTIEKTTTPGKKTETKRRLSYIDRAPSQPSQGSFDD